MNLQLDAAQKTGKLTPELRNQIMFGACTALLDTGSPEIQGMHGEMQLMLGQGTTIEDMILKKQYTKSELNEYFDWYYAGNAVERDRSKELVQESIDTYYGSDKQYEQEQLIQILESQYKGEIAGTMAIFLLSFTPFDEIIDAIQVGNDLAHGDVGGAMLDGIGFIPIAEGFKYIDDLAGLIKSGKKITVVLENGSEVTATIKNLQKALEQLPSGTRILDESGNVIGEIGKHADEIAEGVGHKIKASDIQFSDKFNKPAYKKQVTERGWTNQSIADTINNPVKTAESVNKYTGNSVTAYYIDDIHYVAVDNVTGKVIQVADINKANWLFDLTR
jgi:hypothetical protein